MFFKISGRSMEPGFKEGSLLFVDRIFYRFTNLNVRDVVVIKDPRDSRRLLLKRVSRIEDENLFILGDNLTGSTDSRQLGAVGKRHLVGKVMFRLPNNIQTWFLGGLLATGLVGLIDSIYLAFEHYTVGYTICGIESSGCSIVTGSSYAVLFGIPLALYGVFYYLSILGLGVLLAKDQSKKLIKLLSAWSGIGFLMTLYLLYIQAFVLSAFCAFCLVSAFTSTTVFAIGLSMWFTKGRKLKK